jgi:hypothetical protein
MKGFLNDGPAAGRAVEAGDPPVRRGVVVLGKGGIGEDAHRYYVSSIDSSGAVYTYGATVWRPLEAGPRVINVLQPDETDQRN